MLENCEVRAFNIAALGEFLNRLNDPRAVCTLQVSDGYSERVIYFAAGGVRLLSVGERGATDIASYLLETGQVDVEALHTVLERVRTSDLNLRQVLAEHKILPADDFKAISNRFIRDEIFDLVFWRDAYYKTYSSAPASSMFSKDRPALTGNFDYIELVEEAQKWIKFWERTRRIFESDLSRFHLTSQGRRGIKEDVDGAWILLACREGPTLRELRRRSDLSLPDLCRRIHDFSREGCIKLVPAQRSRREENLDEAIAALEEALPRVIDKELVQEKLARLYERAKLGDKATEQLAELARDALGREDWTAARELWDKILSFRQVQHESFKDYVHAYLLREDVGEVVRLALSYTLSLTEGGVADAFDEVAKILRRMPRAKLANLEFEASWVSSQGRAADAAIAYERAGEAYLQAGDTERATFLFEKGLGCEPASFSLNRLLAQVRAGGKKAARAKKDKEHSGPSNLVALLLVVLVSAGVLSVVHFCGGFEALAKVARKPAEASAEDAKPKMEKKEGPDYVMMAPDETYLPGVGAVPTHGAKGLDPREAFRLNEATGTVSTPLGELPMLGGGGGPSPLQLGKPGGLEGRGFPGDRGYGSGGGGYSGGGHSGGGGGYRSEPEPDGPPPIPPPPPRKRRPRPPEFPRLSTPTSTPNPTGGQSRRRKVLEVNARSLQPGNSSLAEGQEVRGAGAQASSRLRGGAPPPGVSGSVTRLLNDRLSATYARSEDLVLRNISTGDVVLTLPGEGGANWSFGTDALTLCRWKAGEPVQFFNRFTTKSIETSWNLPERVQALAASEHHVAVRVGETTGLFHRDGSAVQHRRLPLWNDGFFMKDSLIVSSSQSGNDGIWAFHLITLELVWSSSGRDDWVD